jgi:hypothetical protein
VSEKSIEERVETLEKDMDSLRALPAKVDHLGKEVENLASRVSGVESQIVLLRIDGSVPLFWTPVVIIRPAANPPRKPPDFDSSGSSANVDGCRN